MLFGKKETFEMPSEKEVAKERLHNILMRDRVDASRELMGAIKSDIAMVVGEYFVLSTSPGEVYLTSMKRKISGGEEKDETVLVALVPVDKVRRETGENEL